MEMTYVKRQRFTRRQALAAAGTLAAGAILAACAPAPSTPTPAPPAQAPAPAPTTAPASTTAPTRAQTAAVTPTTAAAQAPAKATAPAATPAAAAKGPAVIAFTFWGNPEMKAGTDQWVAGFEKASPRVAIKAIHVPTQYGTKLTTLIAAGDAPDVMWLFSSQVGPLVQQKQLAELDDLAKRDKVDLKDFPQGAIQGLTLGGKLVALPQATYVEVLWYNKDLFDAAGVKYPDDTWTWDTLEEAARKLTKGEGGTKQFGFLVRPPSFFQQESAYIWRNGGETFSEDLSKTLLDQDLAVKAVEWYYGLKNDLKVSPSTAEIQATPEMTGGDRAMKTKRVAMVQDTNITPVQLQTIEDIRYDLAVFPLPKGGKRGGPVFSDNVAIAQSSKAKDAAWEFMKYQVGDEAQWIRSATGWNSPARLSSLKDPRFNTLLKLNWQALIDELGWARESLDYLPFYSKIDQVLKPELEAAHAGTKPVKDAILAAVPKMNEVLKTAKQ